MIRFSCPGCGATYSVEDAKGGKTGKCPKCQSQFLIPMPEGGAAPPPPPPRPKAPPPPVDPNVPVEIAPCPKCDARLSVTAADLGVDVECPYCKTVYKAVRAGSGGVSAPKPRPGGGRVADDDDRPSRRGRRDEEEDEDRPRRRRRDEEEEDERPSRRRRDDEEDEDRPSRRSRRGEDEEEDERPSRRRRDDEEDEDRPRKKKRKRRANAGLEEAEVPNKTATNCGIASIILAICCPIAGFICGVIAIINGMKANSLSDGQIGKGGIIMGGIGIVLAIINAVLGVMLDFGDKFK